MTNEIGFTSVVRRWWWLLVIGMLVAGFAAYAFGRQQSPTYASTATLLVGPLNADYSTTRVAGELARTYAEVAKSLPVLTDAIERTGAPLEADELADNLRTTSNDVTRLVTLEVRAPSPELAAALANGLGQEMVAVSRAGTPAETEAIREFMAEPEVERLSQAERDGLRAAAVRVFGAGLTGWLRIIDPAVADSVPVAPQVKLLAVLGALGGLALGAVAALVLSVGEAGRQGARHPVAEVDGIPYLGTVEAPTSGSLLGDQADERALASYRLLATKLELLGGRRAVRSLVVIGAGKAEAGAAVAANLAKVVADRHARVLLVDAYGAVTKLLGVDGRAGYAELVRGGAAHEEALLHELRSTQGERLVVPIGSDAEPVLVDPERARRLLAGLEQTAELVVLSVPPTGRSPAGLVWAEVADGTLVVGSDGGTRKSMEETASSLELVGARLLGTVVSRSGRARLPRLRLARAKEEVAA